MYLIDTCAFLWFLDDNLSLSANAREVIEKSDRLYLSIASLQHYNFANKNQVSGTDTATSDDPW